MASNQPAYAPAPVAEPTGEWDEFPSSDESAAYGSAQRAQHRLPRQRAAIPARGSAVLGIAAMAAVGAGGVAAAADAPPAPPISLPDTPGFPDALPGLDAPAAEPATGIGTPSYDPSAVGGDRAATGNDAAGNDAAGDRTGADRAAVPAAGPSGAPAADWAGARPAGDAAGDRTAEVRTAGDGASDDRTAPLGAPAAVDPGEALRTRIIDQVARKRESLAQAEREAAAREAAKEAAARKVREQAAAAKAAAEAQAKADAEAAARAEADRLARLALSYVKPVASYTLTAGFGDSGNMWASNHTGQDFTAPTGTPVHAIHGGTVTSAGWAGAYGYRVVLRLDDGTELWYCHLSTMVATAGPVTTGDTIGRVGATGNVPEPHLHLEVRPGGGAPIDPVPWLYGHDVAV